MASVNQPETKNDGEGLKQGQSLPLLLVCHAGVVTLNDHHKEVGLSDAHVSKVSQLNKLTNARSRPSLVQCTGLSKNPQPTYLAFLSFALLLKTLLIPPTIS